MSKRREYTRRHQSIYATKDASKTDLNRIFEMGTHAHCTQKIILKK